jgi:hypothetical protein
MSSILRDRAARKASFREDLPGLGSNQRKEACRIAPLLSLASLDETSVLYCTDR